MYNVGARCDIIVCHRPLSCVIDHVSCCEYIAFVAEFGDYDEQKHTPSALQEYVLFPPVSADLLW